MKMLCVLLLPLSLYGMDKKDEEECAKKHVQELIEHVKNNTTFMINPGCFLGVRDFYVSPEDICRMISMSDTTAYVHKIFEINKFWNDPHAEITTNSLFGLLHPLLRSKGSKTAMQLYLERYPYAACAKRYEGAKATTTILGYSVQNNDHEMAELFLQNGANPNDSWSSDDFLTQKIKECSSDEQFAAIKPLCLVLSKYGIRINVEHFLLIIDKAPFVHVVNRNLKKKLIFDCYCHMLRTFIRKKSDEPVVTYLQLLPAELINELSNFGLDAMLRAAMARK